MAGTGWHDTGAGEEKEEVGYEGRERGIRREGGLKQNGVKKDGKV